MKMMYGMLMALTLPALFAVYSFGTKALLLIITGVASAVLAEAIYQKLTGQKITIKDGSAAVTGLLLSLAVSTSTPWYALAISAAFGIIVGKQLFGGFGKNIFNPAIFGRLFYLFAFPDSILPWRDPVDMSTTSTPLEIIRETGELAPTSDLFLGRIPGTLGEISALLLLIGGAYLIYKGYARWRIPASILATVFILALLSGQSPLFHLFAGSLILGSFYMATDPMTSPRFPKAQIIFGIGIGIITMIMREWGWASNGYIFTEGTTFAILGMNLTVPWLNKIFNPRK
ncbi:MAG: RnfABCDGE type electron transport complex subunit D [Bacillota bacterium]